MRVSFGASGESADVTSAWSVESGCGWTSISSLSRTYRTEIERPYSRKDQLAVRWWSDGKFFNVLHPLLAASRKFSELYLTSWKNLIETYCVLAYTAWKRKARKYSSPRMEGSANRKLRARTRESSMPIYAPAQPWNRREISNFPASLLVVVVVSL